jgi:copper chaperone CopZ
MNTSTIIILVIVIAIAALALKGSIGHFKGEGGCCDTGGTILPDTKELGGAKIGEKIVRIEGMHCENCKNRVERAINRIDGAVAKVDLKKKTAVVSFDRDISDEEIRRAVEELDYKVITIE